MYNTNIWFTADTHFWHSNVIKYTKRPFKNVYDMNQTLINNWNKVVKSNDIIYILGDLCLSGSKKAKEIISQLNGYKILIQGNHDKSKTRILKWGINEIHPELIIKINNTPVRLSHYPYRPSKWRILWYKIIYYLKFKSPKYKNIFKHFAKYRINDNIWLLHGHIHNKWKIKQNMINVGVDVWHYIPVSLIKIKKIIFNK